MNKPLSREELLVGVTNALASASSNPFRVAFDNDIHDDECENFTPDADIAITTAEYGTLDSLEWFDFRCAIEGLLKEKGVPNPGEIISDEFMNEIAEREECTIGDVATAVHEALAA